MTPIPLRIATCVTLPEVDGDAEPLAAALATEGFDASLCAWDDPGVDWDAPVATILRSTWNYALDLPRFLTWIDRVSATGPLWNPPSVIRANVHKRYLVALAARGVAVVPTTVVERGASTDVATIARALAATRIVIKPEVGAGSLGTRAFTATDGAGAFPAEADAHLAALTTRGAALVQPYVDSVDGYGERSLVWIDGELSHAIRKRPRFAEDPEQVDGPFPIHDDERATAIAALAPVADQILYGRVDLARDQDDRPMVMELELVEPSLFFAFHPGAAARYATGLRRRLGTLST